MSIRIPNGRVFIGPAGSIPATVAANEVGYVDRWSLRLQWATWTCLTPTREQVQEAINRHLDGVDLAEDRGARAVAFANDLLAPACLTPWQAEFLKVLCSVPLAVQDPAAVVVRSSLPPIALYAPSLDVDCVTGVPDGEVPRP